MNTRVVFIILALALALPIAAAAPWSFTAGWNSGHNPLSGMTQGPFYGSYYQGSTGVGLSRNHAQFTSFVNTDSYSAGVTINNPNMGPSWNVQTARFSNDANRYSVTQGSAPGGYGVVGYKTGRTYPSVNYGLTTATYNQRSYAPYGTYGGSNAVRYGAGRTATASVARTNQVVWR